MIKLWYRLFLEERPSIGLSFFRMFVAMTTGFHVIPTFFHMDDNFFPTAFKELNGVFFTMDFLKLVQQSPEALIVFFAVVFCVSCLMFFAGMFSQVSCIVMTVCCYYFYALNMFFIGTLSWDILLVTLFLMCLTPYHGDYFSVDSLFSRHPQPFERRRPFFIQRLLQIQIASTFFYTALYKITAQGNWLSGNPIFYLMNAPASGVVKHFLLKEWLAMHPQLCYAIGIFVVVMELLLGFLLFYPKTRISAIYLGVVFHILLILTLDVPAIFFFLFPAQFLLFIDPQRILEWIKDRRAYHASAPRPKLVYDGHCGFCRASVRQLQVMDLFNRVEYVDFQTHLELTSLHPQLDKQKAASQIHLVEGGHLPERKKLYGGFFVFRRLCFLMPMLYPAIFIFYAPGSGVFGPLVYGWIAKNRYLLHFNRTCSGNSCFR